jgi:hypothetical protein
MTAITVTTVTLKPGRYNDYYEQVARKAKPILERWGAKNVRLLGGMSGETTGTVAFVMETDDFAAAGAISDKAMADPDISAMMRSSPDGPMAGYQTTQWVDIPL